MKKILILLFSFFQFLISSDVYTASSGICYTGGSTSTDCGTVAECQYYGNMVAAAFVGIGCSGTCYTILWNYTTVPCPSSSGEQPTDVISTDLLPSGTTKVKFRDDAIMLLFPDGSAITFDANGQSIPNRSNGGTTPPLSDFDDTNAFTPNSNVKRSTELVSF